MLTCPRLLSSNRELKYQTSICLSSKYRNISINRCCSKTEPLYSILYYSPHFNFRCIVEHTYNFCLHSRISRLSSPSASFHPSARRLISTLAQFLHTTNLATSLLQFTPWAQTRAFLQCSLTLRGKTPTNAHLHQRYFISPSSPPGHKPALVSSVH